MKFLIKEIRETGKGSDVILSRSDASLVKGLFSMEVPEMQSGAVEIKEIAREAGSRTKVAVTSSQDGVDPVGSLVGQKGVRVQAVIQELGEEKIDIIPYSGDAARFIAAALSPAKDVMVDLNEEEKVAKVKIADNELSLAIGKGGQNVRLAAKLTGWKIDIEGTGENSERGTFEKKEAPVADAASDDVSTAPAVDDATDSIAAVEQEVENDIDAAVKEESADGKVQEEASVEEQNEVVAQAEEDMAADPVMAGEVDSEAVSTESEESDTAVEEKQDK